MLYLSFFALQNNLVPLLYKRIRDLDVQLGILGVFLVLILWMSSLTARFGRKGFGRRKFYFLHVGLVLGLWAVVFFHVKYTRKFILAAAGMYGLDLAMYVFSNIPRKKQV